MTTPAATTPLTDADWEFAVMGCEFGSMREVAEFMRDKCKELERALSSAQEELARVSLRPGHPFIVELDSQLRMAESHADGLIKTSAVRQLWHNYLAALTAAPAG